jgi:hypothetical protein
MCCFCDPRSCWRPSRLLRSFIQPKLLHTNALACAIPPPTGYRHVVLGLVKCTFGTHVSQKTTIIRTHHHQQQQQLSLLSRASWGRLEMKPTRNKGRRSTKHKNTKTQKKKKRSCLRHIDCMSPSTSIHN